jgi:hypothetical protein
VSRAVEVELIRAQRATTMPAERGKVSHHPKARAYTKDWSKPGRLFVPHLMYHLNLSHSGLYDAMVRQRIPRPDGRHGRRPYWYTRTIAPLLGVPPSPE